MAAGVVRIGGQGGNKIHTLISDTGGLARVNSQQEATPTIISILCRKVTECFPKFQQETEEMGHYDNHDTCNHGIIQPVIIITMSTLTIISIIISNCLKVGIITTKNQQVLGTR